MGIVKPFYGKDKFYQKKREKAVADKEKAEFEVLKQEKIIEICDAEIKKLNETK